MNRTERYQILATIQEGMAAVTYKAHDRVLDRPVLLKVMHTRLASDSDLVARFRREALLQARLKHPGIVTVYDFGADDDFYIASEFIDGQTMEKLLQEKGRLTLAELAPIMQAVIHALTYAHQEGVVHRDLKPANILISSSGEVKLTDFGLACARDMGELTQEGCVIGTPSYMSPEQARGLKVDVTTDVFALGIIIYQALSGTNPFAASNYADALSLVLNHDPRPLSELVRDVPPGLGRFVDRMLAKNPSARPTALDGLPRLLAATPQARTVSRRRPLLVALIAPAVLAAVVIAIVLVRTQRPSGQPPGKEIAGGPVSDSSPSSTPVQPNTAIPMLDMPPAANRATENTKAPANDTGILKSSNPQIPPEKCRLRIMVTPWADVAIDGRSVGTTPLSSEPVLVRGRHTITLRNPYYPEVKRAVDLSRANCTLAFSLDLEVAELDIRVTPWAVVAIDGRVVDTTPMDRPIPVALGSHEITLTHPELGVHRESIHTDSARVYRVAYSMNKKGEEPR